MVDEDELLAVTGPTGVVDAIVAEETEDVPVKTRVLVLPPVGRGE